jgi:hypothetical protein
MGFADVLDLREGPRKPNPRSSDDRKLVYGLSIGVPNDGPARRDTAICPLHQKGVLRKTIMMDDTAFIPTLLPIRHTSSIIVPRRCKRRTRACSANRSSPSSSGSLKKPQNYKTEKKGYAEVPSTSDAVATTKSMQSATAMSGPCSNPYRRPSGRLACPNMRQIRRAASSPATHAHQCSLVRLLSHPTGRGMWHPAPM